MSSGVASASGVSNAIENTRGVIVGSGVHGATEGVGDGVSIGTNASVSGGAFFAEQPHIKEIIRNNESLRSWEYELKHIEEINIKCDNYIHKNGLKKLLRR